jgi:hypothetical protein
MSTSNDEPIFFTGEWLGFQGEHEPLVAYQAAAAGTPENGFFTGTVTRMVMSEIVSDNNTMWEKGETSVRMQWHDDVVLFVDDEDLAAGKQVLVEPDAQGMYAVGFGHSWVLTTPTRTIVDPSIPVRSSYSFILSTDDEQIILELREFLEAQRRRLVEAGQRSGMYANASVFRGSHATDLWQMQVLRRFVVAEIDGEKIMTQGE